MKNLIFSSLVGLALVTFTGCTNGSDAGASKCDSAKKCQTSGKCGDAKKAVTKCDGAKKCSSSPVAKCGK